MAKNTGMIAGFKEFISRGSVVDLAVGVVIGAAFTAIVNALVDGILMPIIAGIFGKPNFDKVGQFVLNGSTVKPGMLITALVNFFLVALGVYFFFVVPINALRRRADALLAKEKDAEAAAEEVSTPADVALLQEIRDLLANQNTAKVAAQSLPQGE